MNPATDAGEAALLDYACSGDDVVVTARRGEQKPARVPSGRRCRGERSVQTVSRWRDTDTPEIRRY
jgi:hypothetical protein